MDPISALIGGGASIIGGLMNTSSAQSINAAQIQQANLNRQMAIDTQTGKYIGDYMQNLVSGANSAGINPLAALGVKFPGSSAPMPGFSTPQPGAGLQQAGALFSRMDLENRELDLQRKREDLMHQAALTKQTNIDNAIRQKTLNDLESGRTISGPQPASDTSITGATIQGGKDIFNQLPKSVQEWQSNVRNSLTGAPFLKWYDDFYNR